MKITTATVLLLTLLLTGCQSRPAVNHIPRLLAHPEFPAALAAAPNLTREMLTIINDQQRDLTKLKVTP